jgi:dihydroorotase
MHVHLREPGEEYKEDVASGTRAAAAGGVTTIACMANTSPVNDNSAVTQFILERAKVANGARVYPIGALSVGLAGEKMAEIGEMHRAGIVAVSDDGRPVMDASLMRRALEYTRMFGIPVIAHEEDDDLCCGGVMNEGATSLRLGLKGRPAAAEDVMVARDIALAELTGGRVHVAHVSTAGAVELIRAARARGVAISAEVTPHHLFLTEEAVGEYDTNAKMAPPLRTAADVAAVRAGLADGTIEAIASDHAPHHADEKDVEFDHAAFGIVGLETALGLGLRLVAEGVVDLPTLIARMSVGPARLLGLPAGTLAPGALADVTLVDTEKRWKVAARAFRTKGRNMPYEGWDMTGRVTTVLVGGRVVHEDKANAPSLVVPSGCRIRRRS